MLPFIRRSIPSGCVALSRRPCPGRLAQTPCHPGDSAAELRQSISGTEHKARGLPYAQRELTHGMHWICYPANNGEYRVPRCWTEPRAPLWYASRKAFRVYLHWHSMSYQQSAVNCQRNAVQAQDQAVDLSGPTKGRPVVVMGVFPCLSDQHSCIGTVKEPVGHPIPICAPEVIHGKTGSAPSGAVLFGPFSYANKKKDEEEKS